MAVQLGPLPPTAIHWLELHVRAVIEAFTRIAARQDRRNGHGRAQPGGKGRALARRAGAAVAVLAKEHAAGALVARGPNVPAGAVDDGAHARALEDDARVLAPRPPQVVGAPRHAVAGRGGDAAAVEDVVGAVAGGAAAVRFWGEKNIVSINQFP